MNLYDEQASINHVKSLGFTRHAASDGETKTINYIRKELDKENLDVRIESFEWTKTSTKFRKVIFLWLFIVILSSEISLLYPTFTWLILPLDGLFFLVLILGGKYAFDHSRIIFVGKKRESKNIITTIKAKELYPKRPLILFSAHHDSVSSNLPFKVMKPLYISMLFLLISSLLINLVLAIWSIVVLFTAIQIDIIYLSIRNISLIIGIILLTEIFITFFSKKTNQSIGSIDNASGVAILLELAKLINKNPLEKTDVIFLWCGAEEMGLWGSKQYCSKHFEELDSDYDLNKSYNINVDMVGTYIGLIDETGLLKKKKLNQNLNDVLKASDTKQKILSESPKMALGAGSDHSIFHKFTKKAEKHGFQISCFLSNKDSKYIHSKKDIPELCSVENLNGCIDICYNAIKSLDLRVE
ncbi:MAG: M28 family peptidase [Candidatus Lokiarchaeota archaeon]|nr:M28 family peptidase [Candidatus Lokiarchaeota archaeon]